MFVTGSPILEQSGSRNVMIYINDDVPVPDAKFVLVLDNSRSMSDCNRLTNLKTTMKRWVNDLRPFTKVAIVTFGSSNVCATVYVKRLLHRIIRF